MQDFITARVLAQVQELITFGVHAQVQELLTFCVRACAGARTGSEEAQNWQNRDSAPAPNAVQRNRTPAVALAARERVA